MSNNTSVKLTDKTKLQGKVKILTNATPSPTPVIPPPAGQYGSMNIPIRIYINSASTGRVFGGGFTNATSYFYSDNGTDWTTLNTLPSDQYWTHGVYLPHANRYVMMSGDPAKLSDQAAYSNDGGQTWTAVTLPYSGAWCFVEYSESVLVALNSQGNTAAYSTDNGATWTGITMPSNGTSNEGWNQIAYGNGVFVAVAGGYDGSLHKVVGYSEDGINWTTKTVSDTDRNWGSISFGNGKFVLLEYNNSGTCFGAHSTDGITWTEYQLTANGGADGGWNRVVFGNNKFVAVKFDGGTNQYMTSVDGINWTTQTFTTTTSWQGAVYMDSIKGFLAYAFASSDYQIIY